jgi:hypothetical protein
LKEGKNPVGRPSIVDDAVVQKLEEAFAIGCNDTQACAYVSLNRVTFYAYIKKHPEFLNRINDLKQRPVLKARKTIYENLNEPGTAKWFLERKLRDEFGDNKEATAISLNGQFVVLYAGSNKENQGSLQTPLRSSDKDSSLES